MTKLRTGGPRPRERTTWNGGGRKGGRGRQIARVVVAVVVAVVAAVVVVADKGAEGAANNLGDRGWSYGGPKREGRVIV